MTPSQFSVPGIITILVALYGAGLSTYLVIRNLILDKPKLSVTYGWSSPIHATTKSPDTLTLHATNVGRREVVVYVLALELEGYVCITPGFLEYELLKFPKSDKNKNAEQKVRLKPGDDIETAFDASQIAQFVKRSPASRVRAYCEDTLENRFLGTWFVKYLQSDQMLHLHPSCPSLADSSFAIESGP